MILLIIDLGIIISCSFYSSWKYLTIWRMIEFIVMIKEFLRIKYIIYLFKQKGAGGNKY
jgi:hypothetical protein